MVLLSISTSTAPAVNKKCVLQQNNLSASRKEKGEIDNSTLVLLKVLDGNTSKYCLATKCTPSGLRRSSQKYYAFED